MLAARLSLAQAELHDPADRIERLRQGARIVTTVVDDRFAVAIRDANLVRHLVGADHVASTHLCRLLRQRLRHQVDGPLHGEGCLRPSSATIGRVRNFVGDGDLPCRGKILDSVRPGQMHGSVVGNT
jgi:hypothetical protein